MIRQLTVILIVIIYIIVGVDPVEETSAEIWRGLRGDLEDLDTAELFHKITPIIVRVGDKEWTLLSKATLNNNNNMGWPPPMPIQMGWGWMDSKKSKKKAKKKKKKPKPKKKKKAKKKKGGWGWSLGGDVETRNSNLNQDKVGYVSKEEEEDDFFQNEKLLYVVPEYFLE